VGLHHLELRPGGTGHLADGTLACPGCDFPTSPTLPRMKVDDPLACPYCHHWGTVRDFLTLTDTPRPARVRVTVRVPPLPAR